MKNTLSNQEKIQSFEKMTNKSSVESLFRLNFIVE